MQDFAPTRRLQQRRERREVGDPDGVDERDLAAGRDLDQAEARPEGALEDELGVECNVSHGTRGAPALDARGELVGPVDPQRFVQERSSQRGVCIGTAYSRAGCFSPATAYFDFSTTTRPASFTKTWYLFLSSHDAV